MNPCESRMHCISLQLADLDSQSAFHAGFTLALICHIINNSSCSHLFTRIEFSSSRRINTLLHLIIPKLLKIYFSLAFLLLDRNS